MKSSQMTAAASTEHHTSRLRYAAASLAKAIIVRARCRLPEVYGGDRRSSCGRIVSHTSQTAGAVTAAPAKNGALGPKPM